jgi:tetratricopeptide (TPR) repeat protein
VQLATIDAHLGRARMYMERRLYPQAFADYDRAVALARELDTENIQALAGHAEAAFNVGDFRQAREDLETLIEVAPSAVRRLMLGQVQVQLEDYEDAAETITAALGDGTLSAERRATAHEYLARAYYHQAEAQFDEDGAGGAVPPLVTQALSEIESALDGDPSAARYYYRGLIHELAGNLENARADYEWVLSWQDVYGYAFRVDALDHLDAVNEALAEEASS